MIEFNKNLRGSKKMSWQAGDVIKVSMKIKEGGKERIQVFEGLVIAVKGRQSSSPTLTVRKVSHGVGVEMILPLLSPNISKITLVKRAKIRRAKLYYVRELSSKKSRMKFKDIAEFIKEETEEAPVSEEAKEEKLEETKEVVEAPAEKK
ncbi:MAG TPA: 50S ribosomal protein L19 [Candidatus Kapabacteria bacterium]|nr:50S ribosomal protein L19 [Candidatus Kapabacteria bacterium]